MNLVADSIEANAISERTANLNIDLCSFCLKFGHGVLRCRRVNGNKNGKSGNGMMNNHDRNEHKDNHRTNSHPSPLKVQIGSGVQESRK